MRKEMKKIGLGLLSLVTLIGCQSTNSQPKATDSGEIEEVVGVQDEAFLEFLDDEFEAYVTSDPSAYHFTLKDGDAYGIEKPELTWGDFTLESFDDYEESLKESLEVLSGIDRSLLSKKNQRYYDIIKRDYEDDLILNQYPLHPNYFSSNTGVQENFIIILTEWVFYDEEDVEDYLILLEDVERYFGELIDFGKIQIDDGFWNPSFVIQSSMDSIELFTSKKEDNALIITFDQKIDELGISNADEYKQKNKEIVLSSVLPGYQNIYDFLKENKDIYQGTGASYEYPNGKEYYEALTRAKTSSLMSVEEFITMGDEYYQDTMFSLFSAIDFDNDKIDEYYSYDPPMLSAEEILKDLEKNYSQDYPKGPSVNYVASYLDPSVANESTIAYYLSPPVDAIEDNVIRINGSYNSSYLDFVNTLAHEGFPGHLYQFTYLYDQGIHPMMHQLDYIGYTEGWAMMAGNKSIEWLELPEKSYVDIFIADQKLGYVSSALLDMKVNYLGWTAKDIADQFGISEVDARSSYEFAIESKGLILPYGMGMMLLDLMEEDAKDTLKDKFDQVDYNRMLLEYGVRSFEEIEKDVNEYVQKNK